MIRKLDNSQKVIKKWGSEEWLLNDPDLCIKRMVLRKKTKCSLHFHKVKKEVFRIEYGHMTLDWVDTQTGILYSESMGPGDAILLEPNTPHRFYTNEDKCIFLEFSTHHEDSDSYRVLPSESDE